MTDLAKPIDADAPSAAPVTNRKLALAVLALAQVVLVLDSTVVNVALPSIQREYGLTEAHLAWIVNGYALAFGGCLLLGGRLADLYGRRRLFMLGIAIFTVATLLAGLAWSADVIVVMRFIQGLGAALVAPAALSSVSRIFTEPKERSKALAFWGGLSAFGATLGAVISGVLTEYLNWRWVFLITVPVTVAALVLAPKFVPESKSPDNPHLDVVGSILVTLGIGTAVFALLDKGADPWNDSTLLLRLGIAAVLLIAFAAWESRSKFPMVPLSIFKNRNRAVGFSIAAVSGSVLTTYFFSTTLYMQTVLDYSPLKTGLAYLPFGAAVLFAFPVIAALVGRFGVRFVMPAGLLIASSGLFTLSTIDANGSYLTDVVPGMVLLAIGSACGFATFTIAGVSGTTDANAGIASGILNAGSQVGSALGLATFVAIAISVQVTELAKGTPIDVASVEGFTTTYRVAGTVQFIAAIVAVSALRSAKKAEAEATA